MDERLSKIEEQKNAALNQSNAMYNNLLTDNQNLYNQQQEYANQYETTQNDILDKQLAYNTNLIEQQKQIAKENAQTERNRAKNDYTAFTNPYGIEAEKIASQGLANSGVSETARLGGYNTYQNRLATANKTLQTAITQYDNDINQARLNNDVNKAQNALKKLELQLNYAESYYTNKGNIQQNQFNSNRSIDNDYYNRYQTEYENIQNEKSRQEAIRQWEAQMAYQKQRDAVADAQWEKEYALSKAKSNSSGSGGTSLGNGSYSVISYDQNGWGKTNLTQKLSDGRTAEVYENPDGELLYWNPSTNSWSKYGTVTNKANAVQYDSSTSTGNFKMATTTPRLSSNEAQKWATSNLGNKVNTEEKVMTAIAKGISQGKITEEDGNLLLRSYNLY